MKKFADAILEAETLSKKAPKFAALSGIEPAALRLIVEANDPYRVFHVKKFDEPAAYAQYDAPYDLFYNLLDALRLRQLTGNSARAAVTATLGQYTRRTASVLTRVLKKDLKCGASGDTFVKLYPTLDIPTFDLMLAAKIEEKFEARKKSDVLLTEQLLKSKYGFQFPLIAEAKYDGNRLVAFVENGEVTYNSRSGKSFDHLEGIFDEELAKMEQAIGTPFVLDGEVLASSFQATMKAKGSGNDEQKSELTFYAFDIMSMQAWERKHCRYVQHQRSAYIEKLVRDLKLTKIAKSKYKVINTFAELRSFFSEVIADGHDADGNLNGLGEGLILKQFNGKYEWDRSKNWFKWKPIIDLDLKIVGYEMGTKGTRLEHTIGRLLLEGYDENGTRIVARCGSGLKDADRQFFLLNREEMLGAIVMIECQEITLAEDATVHSARFPIFKKIRDDKRK